MIYDKICAHCGEPFQTNKSFKIYCDRQHYRPCPICGTPVPMIDNDFSRKPRCCSSECTHKLRQQHFKPKICAFCGKEFLPKTGRQIVCEDTHYAKCVICGKLFIKTVGDDVETCSHECSVKNRRIHCLEKYGTEHPMQCKEVQQHHQESMELKYGHKFALQCPEFKHKQEQTNLEEFGVIHACIADVCRSQLPPGNHISKTNLEFKSMLDQYGIDAEHEFKLERFAYDFKLTDTNILLEINPTYTHSTVGNHWNKQGLDKNYHKVKTEWAETHGYQCIHIWDWDNVAVIINQLLPKTKVQADEFKVYKLTTEATNEFLTDNCIHGTCRGQLLCLGLVKNDEIYQVMTFGKSKFNDTYRIEMLRACTRIGYQITGGYDMLSKEAFNQFGIESCIAYQDIAKLSDVNYKDLGMRLDHVTPPAKIWSKDKKYISDSIVQNPTTIYTEEQLLANYWLPIYDCGKRAYVV